MPHTSPTTQQAAQRLLQALEDQPTLSCEQAQVQLPALIEAEFASENVDAQPAFADLLRHLDQCADCMALYSELSEAIEALVGEADTLPRDTPDLPRFFVPQRESNGVVLRVLSALQRRFELTLTPPLGSALPSLENTARVNLFSDTLREVDGAPLIAATLHVRADEAELVIAIRDESGKHWQIQATVNDVQHTAITDAQGIVRFDKLPTSRIQSLTLHCTEIAD